MRDEERIARALEERVRAALAADVEIKGVGVHWHIEVRRGDRHCKINCFWYGAAAGLMLGMNPANARVVNRPSYPVRTGAEYLCTFYEAGQHRAGGRTPSDDDAIAAAGAWCHGDSIDALAERWPFVDATRRRMRALVAPIQRACGDTARCVIEQGFGYELWVYRRSDPNDPSVLDAGDMSSARSAKIHPSADGSVAASFLLGPAQVAFGDLTADLATPLATWMRGGSLAELAAIGLTIEPGAELLEQGKPAAWHWHHFRERIANDDDVLAELRPLLERLARSPIATSFFTYSSLNRLCFSASSHYPWVDDGLPVISPSQKGDIYVDSTKCLLDEAVARIESTLAAYPVKPFLGSAVQLDVPPLSADLAGSDSELRAQLVQHNQWFRIEVARGDRYCDVGDRRVTYRDASDAYVDASYETREDVIAAIRRWLEERCELAALGEVKQRRSEPD